MTDDFKVKKNWVYLVGIALILCVVFGVISFNIGTKPSTPQTWTAPDGTSFTDYYQYYNYYMQHYGQAPAQQPPVGTTPGRDASTVQMTIQNHLGTGVYGATTDVDIGQVVSGTIDFQTKTETITFAAATEQSALYYPQNAILVFHAFSTTDLTGGTDHYDQWYWAKLADGEQVHEFTPSCVTVVQTSPTYKYTWIGGGDTTGFGVHFTSGTTPYWDIGVLVVYPRTNTSNLDVYTKVAGTTLSSMTDGSTYIATESAVTANRTMVTTSEDLYFEGYGMVKDLTYGIPQYSISQSGQLLTRQGVVVMTTDMLSIGTDLLMNEGWLPLSLNTLTAEKAWYKIVAPQIPNRGTTFSFNVKVPVDASSATAATQYVFKFWLSDNQVADYVADGSMITTTETAYGLATAYGLSAPIFARALTVSSGAGATEVLRCYLTTP